VVFCGADLNSGGNAIGRGEAADAIRHASCGRTENNTVQDKLPAPRAVIPVAAKSVNRPFLHCLGSEEGARTKLHDYFVRSVGNTELRLDPVRILYLSTKKGQSIVEGRKPGLSP